MRAFSLKHLKVLAASSFFAFPILHLTQHQNLIFDKVVQPEDKIWISGNMTILNKNNTPLIGCDGEKYCATQHKNNGLPQFVLHVGPGKTGTTAIQATIRSGHVPSLLVSDNYTVIGHDIMHDPSLITLSGGKYRFKPPFAQFFEKQKQQRPVKNIFGSSEYLAGGPKNENECAAWRKLLEKPTTSHGNNGTKMWNLSVLLTYRRLHDALPSMWNQKMKLRRNKENHPLGAHIFWPGVNGDHQIPTFEEWFIEDILPQTKNGESVFHGAFSAYKRWKPCSDDITLLNYGSNEKSSDVVTNFFCNQVINANHTCSTLLSESYKKKGEHGINNPSVTLDYDILTVHAHGNGMINERWKRGKAVAKVKGFIVGSNETLPLKCPNATMLSVMYNVSLVGEKWALGIMRDQNNKPANTAMESETIRSLSADQLLDFDRDWNRSLEENKFCTVDAVEAMKVKRISDFFRQTFS